MIDGLLRDDEAEGAWGGASLSFNSDPAAPTQTWTFHSACIGARKLCCQMTMRGRRRP